MIKLRLTLGPFVVSPQLQQVQQVHQAPYKE